MPLTATVAQVNTTVAQLWPPAAGAPAGAKRVSIFNAGPNAIYIGPAGTTVLTGYKIPTNTGYVLSGGILNGPIFAIADTALQVSPADTRILVEQAD